eukprot:3764177-Amphidinium_carterae.1
MERGSAVGTAGVRSAEVNAESKDDYIGDDLHRVFRSVYMWATTVCIAEETGHIVHIERTWQRSSQTTTKPLFANEAFDEVPEGEYRDS